MIFDLENILPVPYSSSLCWVFSQEVLPEMYVPSAERFLQYLDISGPRVWSLQRIRILKDWTLLATHIRMFRRTANTTFRLWGKMSVIYRRIHF